MRTPIAAPLAALIPALLLASAAAPAQSPATAPPPTPSEVVAAASSDDWRTIAPENLLVMTLADGAEVLIELAPDFAPVHVENIRRLARAGWYDGVSINRVQDNYVVQWGDPAEEEADRKPLPAEVVTQPPAEYESEGAQGIVQTYGDVTTIFRQPETSLEDNYADWASFEEGWPVANFVSDDRRTALRSLVHCYGMVGVGRGDNPDTGTGAELYAVIGHAPRHLDRNIALVGRVIAGIEALSSLPRGTGPLGFYEDEAQRVPIASVRLASELPEAERPRYRVLRTDTDTFRRYVAARANRSGWFVRPAGAVDVCNVALPIAETPAD